MPSLSLRGVGGLSTDAAISNLPLQGIVPGALVCARAPSCVYGRRCIPDQSRFTMACPESPWMAATVAVRL